MSTFGQRSRITTALSDWMPQTDGPPPTPTIDWLIVAGGGYGSGGAGGMRSSVANTGGSIGTLESVFNVVGGDLYTVTVAAGGAYDGTDSRITKATDAAIFLRSKGGSAQGNYYYNGSELGGSGGGNAHYPYGANHVWQNGQPGTENQGHSGGGTHYACGQGFQSTTGAGGGAGGVGGESYANPCNRQLYEGCWRSR